MRQAHSQSFFQKRALRIAGVSMLAWTIACPAPGGTPAPPPPPDRANDGIAGSPADNSDTGDYLFSVSYLSNASGAEEVVNQRVDCSTTTTPQYARLRMRPVHYAHLLRWDQVAASGKTHLYAEIQVDAACPVLHLNANDVAYLAVGPATTAGAIAVNLYKKGAIGVIATPVATATKITYCNYNSPAHTQPGAHLDRPIMCSDPTPQIVAPGTAPQPPNIPPASGAAMVRGTGLWVSCSTGCCEVQF